MASPTKSQRVLDLEAEVAALRDLLSQSSSDAAHRQTVFQGVLDIVPVGIVLADENGRILSGNDQVEEMLRHPVLHSEDYDSYGEWVSFHADGKRVQSEEYPLSRVLRDGEQHSELDVHYQRGDNSRFWMRIIGRPLKNENGETIGATVVLVDIDDEVRLKLAQDILIRELNHRVKNAFTVSQSIVSRILRSTDTPTDVSEAINDRLHAYAQAHAKLIGTNWSEVPIDEVASDILDQIASGRFTLSGPNFVVSSRTALAFSMAFYELATNALKYGALSVEGGEVQIRKSLIENNDDEHWKIEWIERNGPRPNGASKQGFGSFITGRALMMETRGRTTTEFAAEGLEWSLIFPVAHDEGEID